LRERVGLEPSRKLAKRNSEQTTRVIPLGVVRFLLEDVLCAAAVLTRRLLLLRTYRGLRRGLLEQKSFGLGAILS